MSFQSLSQEEIEAFAETAEKIAQRIHDNTLVCSGNRVNIVGSRASDGEKKNGYVVPDYTCLTLNPESSKISYIFNGLVDSRVVISRKVNHVLIRDCQRSNFSLPEGTISGVTILKGSQIGVDLPFQNTTCLEETFEVDVKGEVTSDTIIYVSTCSDISINQGRLLVHPFIRGVYMNGLFYSTSYTPAEMNLLNSSRAQIYQIQVKTKTS